MRFDALFDLLRLGFENLLRNKLRSFLTMLGMIFGVGSVIAMLSVGAGARKEILERIQSLGIENIIVNSVKPPEETKTETQGNRRWVDKYGLRFDDREQLEATCPSIRKVLPVNLVKKPVWSGSRRVDASVLGVLPEHLAMFHLEAGRGRVFNALDAREAKQVCLVRQGLGEELQLLRDPVGATVNVGNESFEIVGVLADEAFRSHTQKALAIDGRTQEVYIPYTTSMRTFGTMTFVRKSGSEERTLVELDQMIVVAKSADLVRPTARIIANVLERNHKRKDWEIVVPLELLQQSERTQAVFNAVMLVIAAISLLVGGIGIANIMLATITERTREIGVRRALGARRRDILLQFLTETATIGVVGGLFGCLFGLAAIRAVVLYTGWQAVIEPHFVLVALGISGGVAVLAGLYPARRAARMDPIGALRYQ
ncbi:MAG: ABC transporter permease [Planctomycetes bacterium]|nr:ABC transporter permease [Planctomycetota bacterium]